MGKVEVIRLALFVLFLLAITGWGSIVIYICVNRFKRRLGEHDFTVDSLYVAVKADCLLAVRDALFANDNELAIKMLFTLTESNNKNNPWDEWEEAASISTDKNNNIVFVNNLN